MFGKHMFIQNPSRNVINSVLMYVILLLHYIWRLMLLFLITALM